MCVRITGIGIVFILDTGRFLPSFQVQRRVLAMVAGVFRRFIERLFCHQFASFPVTFGNFQTTVERIKITRIEGIKV